MQETFSENLKQLRAEKHMTQKMMAKVLNVSRSCVANYETDKRQPDRDCLVAIADYFHVSIDYLMGRGEDVPETESATKRKITEICDKAERKQKLDLRLMDLESKLLLLRFYRYLTNIRE